MKNISQYLIITALITAAATSAIAVPDIRLQGRQSGIWNTIDDGDLDPNQQVTDFDTVNFGDNDERLYRIQNRGNQNLNVSSLTSNSSQFTFVGLSLPVTIGAGDEREFSIRYTPTSTSETATITVRSNDPDGEDPYTFAVTGNGRGPDVRISGRSSTSAPFDNILDGTSNPSTAEGTDFGSVEIGSPVVRHFRISNDGNATLNINSRSFSGADGSDFDVDGLFAGNPISGPLGAGQSREFTITWTPSSSGVASTIFSIRTNDHDEDPYTFELGGSALGMPDIRIQGRQSGFWNNIADGDLDPDQAVTQFDDVEFGLAEPTFYRAVNDGTGTLNVTSVTTDNPRFFIEFDPANIAPGESHEFSITFSPNTFATETATITVSSNDPGAESQYTFALVGNGIGRQLFVDGRDGILAWAAIQSEDFTPRDADGTDFDNNDVDGDTSVHEFRIRNEDDTVLTINSIATNSPEFSVLNAPSSISPNSSEIFEIEFDPNAPGQRDAIVTIVSSIAQEVSFNFGITGFGVPAIGAPGLVLRGIDGSEIHPDTETTDTASGTDFGLALLASTGVTRVFAIENTGSGSLSISDVAADSVAFRIDSFPNTVGPGQGGELRITFLPQAVGVAMGTLSITSDAQDLSSFEFAISGVGNRALAITDFKIVDKGVSLSFQSSEGKSYRIRSSKDNKKWLQLLEQDNISGTGEVITRLIIGVGPTEFSSRMFLRVEEVE